MVAHPDEQATGVGRRWRWEPGAAVLPLSEASDVLARVASERSEARAAARGRGGLEDSLRLRSLKLNPLDE